MMTAEIGKFFKSIHAGNAPQRIKHKKKMMSTAPTCTDHYKPQKLYSENYQLSVKL